MIRRLIVATALAALLSAPALAQENACRKQIASVKEKLDYKDFDGAHDSLVQAQAALEKVTFKQNKDSLGKELLDLETQLNGAESMYYRDEADNLYKRADESYAASSQEADAAAAAKKRAVAKRTLERAYEAAQRIFDKDMKAKAQKPLDSLKAIIAGDERKEEKARQDRLAQERAAAAKAEADHLAAEAAKQKALDDLAKRQQEEIAALKAEHEAKSRADADAAKKAEEARVAAEDARRKAEQEEHEKALAEQSARAKALQEQLETLSTQKSDAEKKLAEETAARKQLEEEVTKAKQAVEEARAKGDAALKHAQDDLAAVQVAKQKAEEDAKRTSDELKAVGDARAKAEADAAAASKKADEEEAKRKAAEEALLKGQAASAQPTPPTPPDPVTPPAPPTPATPAAPEVTQAACEASAVELWTKWLADWSPASTPMSGEEALKSFDAAPGSVDGKWILAQGVKIDRARCTGVGTPEEKVVGLVGDATVVVKITPETMSLQEDALLKIVARVTIKDPEVIAMDVVAKIDGVADVDGKSVPVLVIHALKRPYVAVIPGVGASSDRVNGIDKVVAKSATEGEFKK